MYDAGDIKERIREIEQADKGIARIERVLLHYSGAE